MKLLQAISGMNFALFSFISFSIKGLVVGLTYPDALGLAVCASLYGYRMFLLSKQPDPVRINAEISKELDQIKATVNAIKLEKNMNNKAQGYF